MQVTQLVDVTDVHVLLVDLGFVEVLGSSKTKPKNHVHVFFPCGNVRKSVAEIQQPERLTMRLTEPPIFLVSISSPFMQSLKSKWFICLIPPVSWQNTLAHLRLCITCNPAIVQQVLWPTWQMRFPSLSRSPARSSPAGCTENTGECFYWGGDQWIWI